MWIIPDAFEYRGCNYRVRLTLVSQEHLPAAMLLNISPVLVMELTISLRIF